MLEQIEAEFLEGAFSIDEIVSSILTLGQYLGDSVLDAIIDNLAVAGLVANNNDRFSIGQIHDALKKMFGEGASIFIYPITEALLRAEPAQV